MSEPDTTQTGAGVFPTRLLLIGCSARMLAQSASRAGIRTVVIDHYGDADTRAHAERVRVVPSHDGSFEQTALLSACKALAPAGDIPLVYGSGIDSKPELLESLGRIYPVIGNAAATQRVYRDPRAFFPLLDACGIPYPEVRYRPPSDPGNWLVKSGCSEGGKCVRFCAHEPAGPDEYYQRRIEGTVHSALFLANGSEATLVGISDLWMLGSGERPFLFVGAIVADEGTQSWRHRLQTWIDRLVRATHLKGLNCMDFMIDRQGALHVLEINARPSATMALYDPDFPRGLLASHILAAQHGSLEEGPASGMARAFRVMFAKRRTPVTYRTDWPAWVADRPPAETVVEAGQPLCTIQAESLSRPAVLALIKQRSARLLDIVNGAAIDPPPPHH